MKKLFTIILSAILLTLSCGQAYAQKNKTANDYNLQKAWDVLREDNDEAKAMDLVNQQLRDTPDNVQALLLRVRLYRKKGEYGAALRDLNQALKVNKPKKSEIANSTLHWWKGYVYQDMREKGKAADSFHTAYTLAAKDDRENLQSISFDYAQALYFLKDLDGADAVYRKMLAEDESDEGAMVGMARNMIDRGQYREAVDLLEKAERYDSDYAEIYRFMMSAYKHLDEQSRAIDAGLDWYDKGENADSDSILVVLAKKPNYSVASIKSRSKKSDNPAVWTMLLCEFYEHTRDYVSAIKAYDELEESFGRHVQINIRRSDAYGELGLLDRAVEDISKAIEKESDAYSLLCRGDYYRKSGHLEEAIADFSAAIEEDPSLAFPYYRRGWCYEMKGDTKKAMEDYDLGLEMDDDYPYLYLMRGQLRLQDGDKAGADADFGEVLRRDTVANNNSCRMYALHFLGKDKEAEEWMDRIIAADPDYDGNYYDRACLYSRMGRPEESVTALRTAFEMGYRDFAHIRQDDDMDAVRDLPEFKALMQEYEAKLEELLKEFELSEPEREESITEVAIKRNPGGTFEIACDINGLPLQMIFDTGASDITISSVEANFMLKNGYLSEKDVKGKKYYQIANGQLSEGTVITLREVKVGDAVLRNVDASVVKSQKAPLLLGQSAMERFGTITIDNINNKLLIKH